MIGLRGFLALIRRLTARTITLEAPYLNDADIFYIPIVTHLLLGSLYEDADTFYDATLTRSALLPSLFDDEDTFYDHQVVGDVATLLTPVFTNSSAFFTHTIASVAGNQLDFSAGNASGLVGAFWP